MVFKRVRGWTSGRRLPVLSFVKYPPRPLPREYSSVCISVSAFPVCNNEKENNYLFKARGKYLDEVYTRGMEVARD